MAPLAQAIGNLVQKAVKEIFLKYLGQVLIFLAPLILWSVIHFYLSFLWSGDFYGILLGLGTFLVVLFIGSSILFGVYSYTLSKTFKLSKISKSYRAYKQDYGKTSGLEFVKSFLKKTSIRAYSSPFSAPRLFFSFNWKSKFMIIATILSGLIFSYLISYPFEILFLPIMTTLKRVFSYIITLILLICPVPIDAPLLDILVILFAIVVLIVSLLRNYETFSRSLKMLPGVSPTVVTRTSTIVSISSSLLLTTFLSRITSYCFHKFTKLIEHVKGEKEYPLIQSPYLDIQTIKSLSEKVKEYVCGNNNLALQIVVLTSEELSDVYLQTLPTILPSGARLEFEKLFEDVATFIRKRLTRYGLFMIFVFVNSDCIISCISFYNESDKRRIQLMSFSNDDLRKEFIRLAEEYLKKRREIDVSNLGILRSLFGVSSESPPKMV